MKPWLLLQTFAILFGFLIDCALGDPYRLPHPVVLMGKLISFLEKKLRRGEKGYDLFGGVLTLCILLLSSILLPSVLLFLAWKLHPAVYLVLDSVMCWQIVAARQLAREGGKVQRALEAGDTEGARRAVSYIVGRDTDVLDRDGVCRAAVETVAENTSDGVIAPLIWTFLFGAVGGLFYKAVNTADSMLGYKNEKYLYFGRAAAKTDDFVNFLPARISAGLMILACPLCRLDGKNARRVFLRDRKKHASPNSAEPESVCAGALHIRLAGDAVYGGVVCKKEYIGDDDRKIEPTDIRRASDLMYAASLLCLILGLIFRIGGIFLCF